MIYDVAVIGAGVVGGLTARELTKYRLSVCLLEKEPDVAMGASKANSAIVHGGFDAEPGTLKAKLNVQGTAMMPAVTKELGVPYKNNGSLVVAFDEEDEKHVQMLYERGLKNGVPQLSILSHEEVLAMEPNLSENIRCALLSASAGIVCPYELTVNSIGNAMDNGAELKRNFKVASIEENDGIVTVTAENGEKIEARYVINSAGVYSDEVAALAGDDKIHITPRRGEYMILDKSLGKVVEHTIFQTPSKMGKGILVTPTVDGNTLIGPTATDQEDKGDTSTTADGLNTVIAFALKSVPTLNTRSVITSFTGLRSTPDNHDFNIFASEKCPHVLQMVGIESPGLSSSPAIAVYAVEKLSEMGLALEKRDDFNPIRKPFPKFREMTDAEKAAIIAEDEKFGKIVCRCETITEGEIVEAIRRNPGAVDIDGIKRRTRAGMGRCQAGFCTPQTVEILARELNIPMEAVTKSGEGSELLIGKTK